MVFGYFTRQGLLAHLKNCVASRSKWPDHLVELSGIDSKEARGVDIISCYNSTVKIPDICWIAATVTRRQS